jgi:lysozyme family protein
MSFQKAFPLLMYCEGAWKDNTIVGDPGGETFAGITRQTWTDYCENNKIDDVWPPLHVGVMTFYETEYWKPMHCDQMPEPIDAVYLQLAINLPYKAINGVHRPVSAQLIQNSVGAWPDGELGPDTLQRIRTMQPLDVVDRLLVAQLTHYTDVHSPSDNVFKGLIDRVTKVREYLGKGLI